jgi:hypothetical protein
MSSLGVCLSFKFNLGLEEKENSPLRYVVYGTSKTNETEWYHFILERTQQEQEKRLKEISSPSLPSAFRPSKKSWSKQW